MVTRKKRLRIAAGRFRGRVIASPPGIRPTAGRTREALMSLWQDELAGSIFLDLFAGSGAVGIEALSRGAAEAMFIDQDPRVIAILKANLELLHVKGTSIHRLQLPGGLE
ncbi:MAG: RsmD family RNA methyltransferase, partial [Acidobacteriota bacterium]